MYAESLLKRGGHDMAIGEAVVFSGKKRGLNAREALKWSSSVPYGPPRLVPGVAFRGERHRSFTPARARLRWARAATP